MKKMITIILFFAAHLFGMEKSPLFHDFGLKMTPIETRLTTEDLSEVRNPNSHRYNKYEKDLYREGQALFLDNYKNSGWIASSQARKAAQLFLRAAYANHPEAKNQLTYLLRGNESLINRSYSTEENSYVFSNENSPNLPCSYLFFLREAAIKQNCIPALYNLAVITSTTNPQEALEMFRKVEKEAAGHTNFYKLACKAVSKIESSISNGGALKKQKN